ncbi:type II secretion system protein GspG [Pseudoalteromonas obscura]|uniref:Type II secretion system protein GspG n=1 Tax=Pseudoalteromonas obscura TaxID=3048491 RepID=A0ABT7EF69_9GAMM|nr:type II secretion system protein GspG [Pseudoalteromonas sp. P94(2023)]MDK2593925.1 type II secretion system protein GspG [Pseudoalteromonas sp. P94(2023)]
MKKFFTSIVALLTIAFAISLFLPKPFYSPSSRGDITKLDIQQLGQAITQYEKLEKKDISEIKALNILTQTTPKMIDTIPLDPWGEPYQYKYLGGQSNAFIIWSPGSLDAKAGLIIYTFTKQNERYRGSQLLWPSNK